MCVEYYRWNEYTCNSSVYGLKRSICDCASNNLHKFSLKSSVHFYTSPSSNLKCYTPMILRLLLCQVYVIHYFKYVIGKMSFVSLSSLHIITMYSYDSAWVFLYILHQKYIKFKMLYSNDSTVAALLVCQACVIHYFEYVIGNGYLSFVWLLRFFSSWNSCDGFLAKS